MTHMLRDESTPEGKRIWEDVAAVANRAPEWAKPLVDQAVRATVERIKARMVERIAAGMQMGGAGPEDARNVEDFAAEQARVMARTDGE